MFDLSYLYIFALIPTISLSFPYRLLANRLARLQAHLTSLFHPLESNSIVSVRLRTFSIPILLLKKAPIFENSNLTNILSLLRSFLANFFLNRIFSTPLKPYPSRNMTELFYYLGVNWRLFRQSPLCIPFILQAFVNKPILTLLFWNHFLHRHFLSSS